MVVDDMGDISNAGDDGYQYNNLLLSEGIFNINNFSPNEYVMEFYMTHVYSRNKLKRHVTNIEMNWSGN